ncbi:MAG: BLUF domain-containing protein, partial [Acidobacteriota bacterium]
VNGLFAAIEEDDRHIDVLVLGIEEGITSRLFPDWSMRTVDLDAAAHVRLLPLKIMMQAVYEQRQLVDKMIWAIERTLQHELRSSE